MYLTLESPISTQTFLTLLQSERQKHYGALAVLSAKGLLVFYLKFKTVMQSRQSDWHMVAEKSLCF